MVIPFESILNNQASFAHQQNKDKRRFGSGDNGEGRT
jgi:hypothetical protein